MPTHHPKINCKLVDLEPTQSTKYTAHSRRSCTPSKRDSRRSPPVVVDMAPTKRSDTKSMTSEGSRDYNLYHRSRQYHDAPNSCRRRHHHMYARSKSCERRRNHNHHLNGSSRSGRSSSCSNSRPQHQSNSRHTSASTRLRRRLSLTSRNNNDKKKDRRNKTKRHQVCVSNKSPFDKHGRCISHPEIKLASKKLLGGWKIHMECCPFCQEERFSGRAADDDNRSVASSGISRLTDDSGVSHAPTLSSSKSSRSTRSAKSIKSNRSSGISKRRHIKRKDKSFLPCDDKGYCLNHPNIQLAVSTKKGLKILLEYCPKCAARDTSPIIRRSSSASYISGRSGVSCTSGRSYRSGDSHSTYIESMPYIDGDGEPGHYTGEVDCGSGHPNGKGKMKYKSGDKWEGAYYMGTRVHGRSSKTKRISPKATSKTSASRKPRPCDRSSRQDTRRDRSSSRGSHAHKAGKVRI